MKQALHPKSLVMMAGFRAAQDLCKGAPLTPHTRKGMEVITGKSADKQEQGDMIIQSILTMYMIANELEIDLQTAMIEWVSQRPHA